MITDDFSTLKYIDFGLAKKVETLSKSLTSDVGTARYAAPEIHASAKDYTEKIDLWSLGCVIYEMVKIVQAFPDDSVITLRRTLSENSYVKPALNESSCCKNESRQCLMCFLEKLVSK